MSTAAAITALNAEIDALLHVRNRCLGPLFEVACVEVLALPGKLIVTGMGKAGLIGQKVAATLRSTGQPAAFLDPAQALHGDMGMIAAGDGVLALSNSGKTDEVRAVVAYALELGCRVIAITGDDSSPLAAAAHVALAYSVAQEGCPIGCAPMASAMAMLALGDALAASLMVERAFTPADFLKLHHGGYLGSSLQAA